MSALDWIELPKNDQLPEDPEKEDSWRILPSRIIAGPPGKLNKGSLEDLYFELENEKLHYKYLNEDILAKRPGNLDLVRRGSYYDSRITLYDKGNAFFAKYDLENIIKQNTWVADYLSLISQIGPKRIEAFKKSVELCKKYLTRGEWNELQETHQVTIKSKKHKGRVYVVPEHPGGMVTCMEHGNKLFSSCGVIHSTHDGEEYPTGDSFLAKVMAIKSDEDYFVISSNNYYNGNRAEFDNYYSEVRRKRGL